MRSPLGVGMQGLRMLEAIRFRAEGRGLGYSPARGAVESLLRLAYRGDWPSRLWERWPSSTRVRMVSKRISSRGLLSAGLRLAFVSDLHLGPTTSRRTLGEAFRLLRAAAPDLLVLGGDYVFLDVTPSIAEELASLVASVPARLKVAVMGNHDLWARHDLLEDALRSAGVKVLLNDSYRLDDCVVVGLDDPWTGKPDAERAFRDSSGAGFLVTVCHSPGGFSLARNRGVHLFLCGHTHGGQVALPWGQPIVVPGGQMARRYPHGLHDVAGTQLFVSRGIGGVEIPFRAFAPPDIGVFDLD